MDARAILGVAPNAGVEEIRAAYLSKVKDHPPDRSPEEFERIRDAYERLRDPRRAARETFLAGDLSEPLISLIAGEAAPRRFAGLHPWLEVLKGK